MRLIIFSDLICISPVLILSQKKNKHPMGKGCGEWTVSLKTSQKSPTKRKSFPHWTNSVQCNFFFGKDCYWYCLIIPSIFYWISFLYYIKTLRLTKKVFLRLWTFFKCFEYMCVFIYNICVYIYNICVCIYMSKCHVWMLMGKKKWRGKGRRGNRTETTEPQEENTANIPDFSDTVSERSQSVSRKGAKDKTCSLQTMHESIA